MRKIQLAFSLILLLLFSNLSAQHIYVDGTSLMVNGCPIFMVGANTPWDNWNDFGGNYNSNFWSTHFADMSSYGLNSSRIWISCNGDGQPYVSSDGTVSPPTQAFWDDMDDMIASATANGIYVMATIMSFDHFKEGNGNYMGWRNMVQSSEKIQTFIDNYLLPLVDRYKNNPYLFNIDLCNEPEWIHENASEGQLDWQHLQRYAGMCAAAIHNSDSPVLVSIGSAATKWNSDRPGYVGNIWSDANLQAQSGAGSQAYMDFWHIHYYEWINEYFSNPFTETTAYYGLDDRPCIIGETPGRNTLYGITISVDEMYENPYNLGYCGVMPWTSNNAGSGDFGSLATFGSGAQSFYNSYTELATGNCDNSNNAFLVSLTLDEGMFTPEFAQGVFDYAIEIPQGTAIPQVSATSADANASVNITQANSLPGSATVSVVSQDGSTTNVYTIQMNVYTPVATTLEITPAEVNLQIGASHEFSARVLDQQGGVLNEIIEWSVSAGGALSQPQGVTSQFTSNGQIGEFTITVTSGSLTEEAIVSVSNGVIIPVPDANDWIVTSLWEDQYNTDEFGASAVANDNDALNIIHRAWGYGELYAINEGTGIDIESGVDYNISFDFMDDAANGIASMTIGFGDSWTNVLNNETSTTLEFTDANISSVDFAEIAGTVTATATGESHLYILLSWGGDPANDKPSAQYNAYLRNVSIVPDVQLPDSDGDGTPDVSDGCPNDVNKTEPGLCGCGNDESSCILSQTVVLSQGWNLVSFYVELSDNSFARIFEGTDVGVVKTSDSYWMPDQPEFLNGISEMEIYNGYLIFANTGFNLELDGFAPDILMPSVNDSGWNLVGTGNEATDVSVFSSLSNFQLIKDFDNFKDNSGAGLLNELQSGKAYFLKLE